MAKEYIEREAALKAMDEVCNYDGSGYALANAMEGVIDRFPAADVRPVVLCKDCQYTKTDGFGAIYCEKWDMWEMPQDGFCYKGKRR